MKQTFSDAWKHIFSWWFNQVRYPEKLLTYPIYLVFGIMVVMFFQHVIIISWFQKPADTSWSTRVDTVAGTDRIQVSISFSASSASVDEYISTFYCHCFPLPQIRVCTEKSFQATITNLNTDDDVHVPIKTNIVDWTMNKLLFCLQPSAILLVSTIR